MTEITITLNKETVLEEVSQTTSYVGSKSGDGDTYDDTFTSDEDSSMLERFWNESKNTACNVLKRFLTEEVEEAGNYRIKLRMSESFDRNLKDSIQRSLFSFFVCNIVSKWYNMINKGEATNYASEAVSHLEDVRMKVLHKRKPIRPQYN